MAKSETAVTPAEGPAKRATSRAAAKLREELEDVKGKARAKVRALVESHEGQDMIGEAEGLVGAAGAGLLESQGIRVEISDDMDLPASLVIGPATYVAGRMMGNCHVRKVGFGMTCGGLALGLAEWAA